MAQGTMLMCIPSTYVQRSVIPLLLYVVISTIDLDNFC